MYTFFKFACVGILNTAIDFIVLNALVLSFGAGPQGELFVFFKSVSFLAAVANSYLLNKIWVFEVSASRDAKEPALFFIVSALGLLINVSISFAVFAAGARLFSPQIAANIGALLGTIGVLAWNFIGYRFFVFQKRYEY